jgi:hypothetical protein
VTSGDQRGLGLSACGRPSAESWLLAGGGEAGRQERLVLTNPGENPVTVDLTLHGIAGPVASPNGKGVVVPSRGRVTVLLDSIAGAERSPAVHVAAEGGLVHAALNDYWLDGSVAAGSDDTPAAAPPAREQVVAAVPVDGAGALRVVVPGDDEAVVQARALTPDGPRALAAGGVVRVPGGTVRDLRLDGLPKGTYGLQVRADVPVVAGAVVTRRAQAAAGDLAWSASTTPVRGVAGTPLPRGWIRAAGSASGAAGALGTRPEAVAEVPVASALTVTSTGGRASIEVVTTDATGAPTSRRLTLGADTATSLDLGDARSVWVHRLAGSGALRAGVVATATDAKGGLVSVLPLTDSVLRTTSVGVREVPE